MAEERVQRRLAAILAADVVGYSRLMGEDEAGTLDLYRVPSPGNWLTCELDHGRGAVVIHPSNHDGYYWIGIDEALEPDDEESDGLLTWTKKSVKPEGFGPFLRRWLPNETFEWEEQPFRWSPDYFCLAGRPPAKAATA